MISRLIPGVVLATLLVLCGATSALADDFSKAGDLIKSQAPNLVYKQLCSEAPTGEDKAACRLVKVPTIAFLVCQTQDPGGAPCRTVIATETGNLSAVAKAKLATVTFRSEILGPVTCYTERSANCYGYLANWVSNGRFVNLDDAIVAGKIAAVADDIEKYTKAGGAKATAKNIQAIIDFMRAGRGKYSRICDLQGFYLQSGGFLINDVPELMVNVGAKPVCGGAPTPTYDQVLEGLETLVRLLK